MYSTLGDTHTQKTHQTLGMDTISITFATHDGTPIAARTVPVVLRQSKRVASQSHPSVMLLLSFITSQYPCQRLCCISSFIGSLLQFIQFLNVFRHCVYTHAARITTKANIPVWSYTLGQGLVCGSTRKPLARELARSVSAKSACLYQHKCGQGW